MTPHIWFNSTSPREDREHIEQGIDKFYSLHIHEVNGHEPEAADYQRVANLMGVKFDKPVEITAIAALEDEPIYGFYINLDERGAFEADVRDSSGKTVFEVRAGNSLNEDESSIFDDGYMTNKNDIKGLTSYLHELGVIPKDAQVLTMMAFETRIEERKESGPDLAP